MSSPNTPDQQSALVSLAVDSGTALCGPLSQPQVSGTVTNIAISISTASLGFGLVNCGIAAAPGRIPGGSAPPVVLTFAPDMTTAVGVSQALSVQTSEALCLSLRDALGLTGSSGDEAECPDRHTARRRCATACAARERLVLAACRQQHLLRVHQIRQRDVSRPRLHDVLTARVGVLRQGVQVSRRHSNTLNVKHICVQLAWLSAKSDANPRRPLGAKIA